MSLLGMPWLIVNLGSEMVYILDQRLKAQNITPDKSTRVLQDVVETMFEPSFVRDSLFVPQQMYSVTSTRQIFDRLVHSSIMRLSPQSMDKLFELMLMSAKYQLFNCISVTDIVQVAHLHLSGVKELLLVLGDQSRALQLLTEAEVQLTRFYSALNIGELHALRRSLVCFFQDRRVKVSLFLLEGIQLASGGRIVLQRPVSDTLGAVRTYGSGGVDIERVERLQLQLQATQVHPDEFFCHPMPLGSNLFDKGRPKVVPPPGRTEDVKAQADTADKSDAAAPQRRQTQQDTEAPSTAPHEPTSRPKSAKHELNMLAAMINLPKAPAESFKLNLFGNDALDEGPSDTIKVPELTFSHAANANAYKHLTAGLETHTAAKPADDLLDLMDSLDV